MSNKAIGSIYKETVRSDDMTPHKHYAELASSIASIIGNGFDKYPIDLILSKALAIVYDGKFSSYDTNCTLSTDTVIEILSSVSTSVYQLNNFHSSMHSIIVSDLYDKINNLFDAITLHTKTQYSPDTRSSIIGYLITQDLRNIKMTHILYTAYCLNHMFDDCVTKRYCGDIQGIFLDCLNTHFTNLQRIINKTEK